MHVKKVIEKHNNLKRIHQKTDSNKNILMINIVKLSKLLNTSINNALECDNYIEALSKKYDLNNVYLDEKRTSRFFFKTKAKELWIFVTEEQKADTDPYSRYKKIIKRETKTKKIDFITIGSVAKAYCDEKKLNVIHHFDSYDFNDSSYIKILTQLTKFLYKTEDYSKVNVIINSNKNSDNYFTILPIRKFNVKIIVDHFNRIIELKLGFWFRNIYFISWSN